MISVNSLDVYKNLLRLFPLNYPLFLFFTLQYISIDTHALYFWYCKLHFKPFYFAFMLLIFLIISMSNLQIKNEDFQTLRLLSFILQYTTTAVLLPVAPEPPVRLPLPCLPITCVSPFVTILPIFAYPGVPLFSSSFASSSIAFNPPCVKLVTWTFQIFSWSYSLI